MIDSEVASLADMGDSDWTMSAADILADKAKNLDRWASTSTPSERTTVELHEFFEVRDFQMTGQRTFTLGGTGIPGFGPGFNECIFGVTQVFGGGEIGDCVGVYTPSFTQSSETFLPDTEKGVRVLGRLTLTGLGAEAGAGPSFSVLNTDYADTGRVRRALLVERLNAEGDPPAHISLALGSRFNVQGSKVNANVDDHAVALFEDGSSLRYGGFDTESSIDGEAAPVFPPPTEGFDVLSTFCDSVASRSNQFHITNKRKGTGDGACCLSALGGICMNVGGAGLDASEECARNGGTFYESAFCGDLTEEQCPGAFDDCGTWPAFVFDESSYIGLVHGACCHESSCDQMTERECAEIKGCYLGDLSECSASVCSSTSCEGACCDGETCTLEEPGDCFGTFQGSGTSCSDAGCGLEPHGACCIVGDVCEHLSAEQCLAEGGLYSGNGTECSVVICTTGNYRHLLVGLGETTFDIRSKLWNDSSDASNVAGVQWNARNVDIVAYDADWGETPNDDPKIEAISVDVCNILFLDAPAAKYWRSIGVQNNDLIVKDCRENQAAVGTEALYFSDDIVYDGSGVALVTDTTGPRVYYGGTVYLESGTEGSTIIGATKTRYGDFDADCDVDLHDVLAFQNRFGQDAETSPQNLNVQLFDYDGDREVSLADYTWLQLALDTFSLEGGNPTASECDPSIAAEGLNCPFTQFDACEVEAQEGGGGAAPMFAQEESGQELPEVEAGGPIPSLLAADVELWPIEGDGSVTTLVSGTAYEVHFGSPLESMVGFVLFAVADSDGHGFASARAAEAGPWAGAEFAYVDLLTMGGAVPAGDYSAGQYRYDMVTADAQEPITASSGLLGYITTESAGTLKVQLYLWDGVSGSVSEAVGRAEYVVEDAQ